MLQGVYRGYAGSDSLPEQIFAANQRQLAEFYAARRAAQTGEDPHVDMLLINPNVGRQYRLHPPGAKEMSGVRKIQSEVIEGRTNLYAKGGRVQNPDQMTHKPFNKAANPITQLLRGWAAGTAGLPGDIEGLARLAQKYTTLNPNIRAMDTTPVLPTSEFYQEWLPGRDTNVGGEAMGAIGSLFGGAGATSLARPIARAGGVAGRQALAKLAQAVESGHPMVASASPMNVVKAKGGNWLNDSVERSVRGLKQGRAAGLQPITPEILKNEEASYLEFIRDNPRLADLPNIKHEIESTRQAGALNNWIDKQLTRYIKNDMATPEDPIRALAERGILHVDPGMLNFRPETHGKYLEPGQTAVAKSLPAKAWEGASDLKTFSNTADDFLGKTDEWVPDDGSINSALDTNPWLAKVPPKTPVYGIAEQRTLPADLGFSHLMDEMRNMLNPESGLPPELLLKYSALNNVSVPQAVEWVAKVNAWREAQKVAANQALANNAATVLHKDYPGQGYKWVQLKQPAATRVEDLSPTQKDWYREYLDGGVSHAKALEAASKRESSTLADALKYEGDTMGHCVGGYCDDVASGKSNIFSLRDSKGQPHVTIETRPGGPKEDPRFDAGIDFEEQAHKDVRRAQPKLDDESEDYMYAVQERANELANEWNNRQIPNSPDNIVQIKGKGNRKPADDYIPFVQDFVKSGKWADVGDLQNTGLRRFTDAFNDNEVKRIQEAGHEIPTWATPDEIKSIGDAIWPGQYGEPPRYASGGLVHAYNPETVNTLASQLLDELKAQHGN